MFGLLFLDIIPDEVLEELAHIGVGRRRTESVSWRRTIIRNKGRLLDGFPRTQAQSTDIGRTLVSPPTGLLFLDVPDEVLEELERIGLE